MVWLQQTIVWWGQTIVCSGQIIVWRQQTIGGRIAARRTFGRVGKIVYLCSDLFNTNNLNHEYQFQIFPRFGAGSQW